MGGTNPAVLGLLCLLSRAVLPGFAQEVSTNQSADLGTEVPSASTVPSIVNSTVLYESNSIVSGFSDTPRGGKDNETIMVTDPPPSEGPSTISVSDSNTEAPAITVAPPETKNSSEGPSPSQGYTDLETRGVTRLSLTQPPPTTHAMTTSVTENVTTGTLGTLTESPLAPATQNNTESPDGCTQAATTTTSDGTSAAATTGPLITTAITTTQPTSPTAQTTGAPQTSRPEVLRDPSVQEFGNHKDVPDHSSSGSNPLFVMIISVFTIMVVMVVVAVGFHRYKKRNRRTDFRRLQDLPMDDMMEDTPLALYSY